MEHTYNRFCDFFAEAVHFAVLSRHVEGEPKVDLETMYAKTSMLTAVFALEAAANCLIDTLDVSKATISISSGHISQATSKMNDSYFNSGGYDETNRRHVMCQEIGHGFGLDHQSESGADLNTCMDYADALDNPSPNQHDYDQLASIYSHSHTGLTLASSADDFSEFGDDPDAPHNWGRLVRQSEDGRSSVYEREHSNGNKTVRHVFWTREAADRCNACDHRYDH